jgi:hypothetical protein
MMPCPQCFAAHYCSQECELKDLFQGTHKHYCGVDYARMVYHASRGLCGLGSRATHRDCYGFNKYCIVAKAAFEPGNVVLQAPVMSGALGSLGFLGQAMNVLWPGWRTFLSEVGSVGRDWAPSLGTVDKSVRNMLRFTLFHRGIGRLVHDEEGKERSLGGLLKLVEKELDEGSVGLVRALAEWYFREKALVDQFWKKIIDTYPSKVDLLRQARASHLMQDSWMRVEVFLKRWVQAKNPDRVFLDSVVFEAAKSLSDYVEEYRRSLPQRCIDMCRLWAFSMYTTPFLGLKTLDVMTGKIVRARMPASGDSLLSVSPVCSFLTHSCYHLNAHVSTVDIMEGKECLKDMDLQVGGGLETNTSLPVFWSSFFCNWKKWSVSLCFQGLGFCDQVFSEKFSTLFSVSTVFAHSDIGHGDTVNVYFGDVTDVESNGRCGVAIHGGLLYCRREMARDSMRCFCDTGRMEQYLRWRWSRIQVRGGYLLAAFPFVPCTVCT